VGEALSNAAQHADATTVKIDVGSRDGRMSVSVCDDGCGFDAEAAHLSAEGFGLRSMRERAELAGYELRLESEPGSGTRLEIALS
jgi:signal transduction histidine kinase